MTTVVNRLPNLVHDPAVPLPYDLKHTLIRSAGTSNGREICGFITSRMSPWFLINTSETPELEFAIDPSDYARAIELIACGNDSIIGVFHSHPSGLNYPSERDMLGWPNPDLGWRYFIVTDTGVYEYELELVLSDGD